MDLVPTDEQEEIADAVRTLLTDRSVLDQVPGYDPVHDEPPGWKDLTDMGVLGLAVDEHLGGAGLGLTEEVLVFRELGRRLVPGPLLGTVLAAHVAGAEGPAALSEALVTGTCRAALGLAPGGGSLALEDPEPPSIRLIDPHGTEVICVCTPEWSGLLTTTSVEWTPYAGLDPSVALAATTSPLGNWIAVEETSQAWWRGALLVAATQVGIAEATLALAVAHAQVREQFGVPIGAFQAVKHRAAEMASRAEAARVQCFFAAAACQDTTGAPREVSAARVLSSEAALQNAGDLIVTLGAMGFSEEHNAHLFARRARLLDNILGSQRWHLEALADCP
jgi:alkylation response protein AidB-like acyl-CoA dehydrogenase